MYIQWCRNRGGQGGHWPPIFGRSVNPIPTGEGRSSPPITTGTPNIFHLPASLICIRSLKAILFSPHVHNENTRQILSNLACSTICKLRSMIFCFKTVFWSIRSSGLIILSIVFQKAHSDWFKDYSDKTKFQVRFHSLSTRFMCCLGYFT